LKRNTEPTHEVVVPAGVFALLRGELGREVGTLPSVRAMHHAGYQTGSVAGEAFLRSRPDAPEALDQRVFWGDVARYCRDRGWGTLTHESPHPGFGILRSTDWSEASGTESPDDPEGSCAFTTGYLTGFLSACARAPLAVLEVTCRSRGDDACRFAFGSEEAVHELYGRMLNGLPLSDALSEL